MNFSETSRFQSTNFPLFIFQSILLKVFFFFFFLPLQSNFNTSFESIQKACFTCYSIVNDLPSHYVHHNDDVAGKYVLHSFFFSPFFCRLFNFLSETWIFLCSTIVIIERKIFVLAHSSYIKAWIIEGNFSVEVHTFLFGRAILSGGNKQSNRWVTMRNQLNLEAH